jgi:uncharacterized membrane protein YjjB (DUF3815 family)
MEIKINREILGYTENMFFGLTLRQIIFSALAAASGCLVYMLSDKALGNELSGWLSVIAAFPFAAAGFFRYNGMSAEEFAVAFIISKLPLSGELRYKSELNIFTDGKDN